MTILKAFRFSAVGIVSGMIYALTVAICVGTFLIEPKSASLLGYLAALPVNFLGQRHIAFKSAGGMFGDVVRYLVVQAFNMLSCWLAMWFAVDWLEFGYLVGVLISFVAVPLITFVLLNTWVFQIQRNN